MGLWNIYQEDFENVLTNFPNTFLAGPFDSDRWPRDFAFDGFPGKMVLFTDVLFREFVNFAINKINFCIQVGIIKILFGI